MESWTLAAGFDSINVGLSFPKLSSVSKPLKRPRSRRLPSVRRRLVLVRHGEVESNWRERIYGRLDVPLSKNGEGEMRAMAERFGDARFDAVVSSGLARAEFGARLLREARGLVRRDEPDLVEIDRGDWAGRTFTELERDEPGVFGHWLSKPSSRRPPAGESLEDVRDRVAACLARLTREHPGDVAVVAHSWVLKATACHLLGLSLDRAPDLTLPTGGALLVDYDGRRAFDEVGGRNVRVSAWNPDRDVSTGH